MVLAAYLGMNLAVWSGDSYKPFEWFVWGLQGVARINTPQKSSLGVISPCRCGPGKTLQEDWGLVSEE